MESCILYYLRVFLVVKKFDNNMHHIRTDKRCFALVHLCGPCSYVKVKVLELIIYHDCTPTSSRSTTHILTTQENDR